MERDLPVFKAVRTIADARPLKTGWLSAWPGADWVSITRS